MFLYYLIKILIYIPFCLSFPCKIVGRKNMPKGAAVIVCNHTSNCDALQFAAHFSKPFYYLAKKELFDTRLKAFVIKGIGGIKIDRGGNDLNAIKKCLKVLRGGHKLVIFPEGTRVHNQNMELGQIKGGAAMLAIKTKVPIVPIYFNKRARLFRRIKMTIGQPFELDQFYQGKLDSEKQEEAGEILAQKLEDLRKEVIEFDSLSKKERRIRLKEAKKQKKSEAKA